MRLSFANEGGRRRAVTFVEILVALLVIAGLGVTVQGLMVSTLQGIQIDRVTEMKRNLTLDLLERFCHPYSDIDSLFPPSPVFPASRELSLDEAIAVVALPTKEATVVKAVLQSAGINSFSLTWQKGLTVGTGDPAKALRLDQLFCRPVESRPGPGAQINSFRVFYVRGS